MFTEHVASYSPQDCFHFSILCLLSDANNLPIWDNGSDVTIELENLLSIRRNSIANFSKDNIKFCNHWGISKFIMDHGEEFNIDFLFELLC